MSAILLVYWGDSGISPSITYNQRYETQLSQDQVVSGRTNDRPMDVAEEYELKESSQAILPAALTPGVK